MEVVWMVTALVILATICIGVSKSLIGDSVGFRRGPRDFILDHVARNGEPCTISFMGMKHTVVSSPETIKYVLSTAHASFPGGYSRQFFRLLGEGRFADARHPHFRKIILAAASGDGLQTQIPFISSLAEKTVKSWEGQPVVNSVNELQKFVLNVAVHILWRKAERDPEEMEQIRKEISRVAEALVVLPINLPGFSFHKALQTRKILVSRLQNEITRRRESGIQQNDVLNALMSLKEVEVTDYDICCIMLAFLFAASATTASLIPWVLKYLDDFPEVRLRVQEEQDGIREKMIEDESLTWFRTKTSMPYTLQVINEIMRIESLVMFVPRKANKDVEYNGILFRKDSYVWASSLSLHYNPENFPNPREFDPSRFAEKAKPNAFMPFGQGPHLCPGSELALTETMFIVHHLVTNYSWERCGPVNGVTQLPIRKPGGGYPIHLVKRCTT